MVCYRRGSDHIKILTHPFPTCHFPAENFSVSPEPQGEIQTISYNIQGSHLPFQSYLSVAFSRCPKLIMPLALTPSLCISLLHLSVSCSSSHTHRPCSELSGRSCPARVLYTHYRVTLFHSCHLSRCHLTIIFRKARKVLYLCTPTVPGPENLQRSESPFVSILPAKGYT